MCGRYSLFAPPEDLEAHFDVSMPSAYEPSYNLAPGQSLPVVTEVDDEVRLLEWGLIPSWADDPGDGHINARAETVEEKPSFRDAVRSRRCLVLADGFYEWVDTETGTQPYRVAYEDDRPFAMAGIWERWEGTRTQVGLDAFGDGAAEPETEIRETFSILTTDPNDLVADLHHRMAVVLPPGNEREWLRADTPDRRRELLDPIDADGLQADPVSQAVNDPSVDRPGLIEPVS